MGIEDSNEDYGQVAFYLGSIPGMPRSFDLDDQHSFLTSKPQLVCGNTAAMLSKTRYAPHFLLEGDRSVHFGLFGFDSVTESGACCTDKSGGACC